MRLLASCCYKKQPVKQLLVFDSDNFRNPLSGSILSYQCEGETALGRRIGIEDIGYYAARVTVYEKEIFSINGDGKRVKRDCVSHYKIDGLRAIKYQEYSVGKKKKKVILEEVFISDIYDRIKMVIDFNNVLIARRINRKSSLVYTAKGMSKFLQHG